MAEDQSASRNSEASIEVHWKASAEFRFWLHDPEGDGMCYFRTAADRDAYAKKAIAGYCDDTWAEEVEGVVGGEVTHVATRVNEKQRPPDDEIDEEGIDGDGMYWGDSDIQSQCGYELAPLAPVSERRTINAAGVEKPTVNECGEQADSPAGISVDAHSPNGAAPAAPVAWRYRFKSLGGVPVKSDWWRYADTEEECNQGDNYERQPLYAPVERPAQSERGLLPGLRRAHELVREDDPRDYGTNFQKAKQCIVGAIAEEIQKIERRAKGPAACGRSRLSAGLGAVPPEPTFNGERNERNDLEERTRH